jgi:hypothetical protein
MMAMFLLQCSPGSKEQRKSSLRLLVSVLLLASSSLAFAQSPPRIGAVVAESNLLTRIDPAYAALPRAARVQGRVTMEVAIDREGKLRMRRC